MEETEILYSLEQEAESLQSLQDWLNKNFKDKKCPDCGNDKWLIPDTFLELRPFTGGGLMVGTGPIYPYIALSCASCGYTLLFNAVIAGLVKKSE